MLSHLSLSLVYFLFFPTLAQLSIHYGIGPCPRVKPTQGFDVTKIYGGKWYMIAHYLEENILSDNLHCQQLEFHDGNPGTDVCRVDITNNSMVYDTGEMYRMDYERLIPDPTLGAVWINTVLGPPINSIILDTDYDDYMAWHECSHFPRDNPIVHEQHNYIFSRTAVWDNPKRGLEKAFDVYEQYGISIKPFVLLDQKHCKKGSN